MLSVLGPGTFYVACILLQQVADDKLLVSVNESAYKTLYKKIRMSWCSWIRTFFWTIKKTKETVFWSLNSHIHTNRSSIENFNWVVLRETLLRVLPIGEDKDHATFALLLRDRMMGTNTLSSVKSLWFVEPSRICRLIWDFTNYTYYKTGFSFDAAQMSLTGY